MSPLLEHPEHSAKAHVVRLPRHRLRASAEWLLRRSPPTGQVPRSVDAIKVVIVSDTHNKQPVLPDGDLLIHAGDMSEWGSFDEIQEQLTWIAAQPHQHKVIIAGNHDVLFDQQFLDSHKERFPVQLGKTAADLDFGGIIYLEDAYTTLTFPNHGNRQLHIYGSPLTPKYVDSAFQYPRDADIWEGKDLSKIDILITHGPAWRHLDGDSHSGCQYLAHAVARWKPRLHVFGHIHVGYGAETVRYDSARCIYEDIQRGWAGWSAIPALACYVLLARAAALLRLALRIKSPGRLTQHINAAVLGEGNQLANEATITYL